MEERLIETMPGINLGLFYGYNIVWNEVKDWPRYDRGVDASVLPNVWIAK